MTRAVASALLQRETGRRLPLALLLWFALGAATGVADVRLVDAELPGLISDAIHDFPETMVFVLAVMAAFQIVSRSAEDRLHGWLLGWCGSGGRREHYVIGLYGAVCIAMLAALATSVFGFTATQMVLRGNAAVLHDAGVILLYGTSMICAVAAFALVIATAVPHVVAGVTIATLLFFGPSIAIGIFVLKQNLEDPPPAARLLTFHLPPPGGSLLALLWQGTYVMVALGLASWIGRARVGRQR